MKKLLTTLVAAILLSGCSTLSNNLNDMFDDSAVQTLERQNERDRQQRQQRDLQRWEMTVDNYNRPRRTSDCGMCVTCKCCAWCVTCPGYKPSGECKIMRE